MYPLGKQFEVDYTKAKFDDKAIFTGEKYRISILSERLIRLEYHPTGKFVDEPTQLVKSRNFSLPEFKIQQNATSIMIESRYFILNYAKEKPFTGSKVSPGSNLKITLKSREKDRVKEWYYGHPEIRNMGGNMISMDAPVDKEFQRGLYSLDGFASINDSLNLILNKDGTFSPRPEGSIDVYVFMYDKDFKQALLDYYKLTGFPDLIPRFALGNWWSKDVAYNDDDIKEVLRRFERKRIPLSVLLLDNDWHYRNVGDYKDLTSGFSFNSTLFSSPKKMIEYVHRRGIKFGLKVDPTQGFFPHEVFYKQASEFLGIEDSKIIMFDPLNPKVMDVYFKVFLHPLEAIGVDFFWSGYQGNGNLTNLWANNNYLYQDSGRISGKRNIYLARNSIFAPHKNSILYGGHSLISWDTLKKLPFQYLNAANIGVSWWSHDVGGNYGGIEESELYIRHVELGCFSPILRFHAGRGQYYKKEPWIWDPKTENIVADYLRLRHRLIPYLYTEAYNYTKAGTPLVQPFYYNYLWVYDDDLYKNQYYFGSQLLVCPILDKKDPVMNRTVHRFFIPDGIWYDFKTGKKFPGNKKYVSFFKEEDYPVFAHGGSIIPMSNRSDMQNTGISTDMEIQIFPGVSNTYTLYEDDGVTGLYKEGYFLKTSIDYNYLKNNFTVIIRSMEGKSGIIPETRNYKIVFRNTKEADDVTAYFNEQKVKVTYGIDGPDFIVEAKDVPTIGQFTINCKGRDIEIDATRLINDDINSILMDLQIETLTKEKIAAIMFGTLSISKKRIAIRKLKKEVKLSKEYINLFLKLLEYLSGV